MIFASQSDIIRASQKDEYYLDKIKADLTELVEAWRGVAREASHHLLFWNTSYNYAAFLNLCGRGRRRPNGSSLSSSQQQANHSSARNVLLRQSNGGSARANATEGVASAIANEGAVGRRASQPQEEDREEEDRRRSQADGLTGEALDGSPMPSSHLRWNAEVNLLGDMVYYGLTTALSRKTLGEEYSDIMQVSQTGRLPGLRRRLILVILQSLPYYALRKLLEFSYRSRRVSLYNFLQTFTEHALPNIYRCHLIAFFLRGRFLQLAKRLANIRYWFLSASPRERSPSRILAALLAVQLAFTWRSSLLSVFAYVIRIVTQLLYSKKTGSTESSLTPTRLLRSSSPQASTQPPSDAAHSETQKTAAALQSTTPQAPHTQAPDGQEEQEERDTNSATVISTSTAKPKRQSSQQKEDGAGYLDCEGPKCLFCFSECSVPTTTPCGHIFCWSCITQWCATNPTCPLCRAPSQPQELIPLRHYCPSGKLFATLQQR